MPGKILIADRDKLYAQALAMRIQQHCLDRVVESVSDDAAYAHVLQFATKSTTLIVSNSHFSTDDLPPLVDQVILLRCRVELDDSAQTNAPMRMGSVLPILQRLDQARNRTGTSNLLADEKTAKPEKQSAGSELEPLPSAKESTFDEPVNPQRNLPGLPPRIFLILTQTTSGRLYRYADQRCRSLSAQGARLYYLPLMPNFYCRQLSATESGFGLSDLLLRIGSGGLAARDLGAFSAIDQMGRIQFRPTDRADDLLDCRIEDLYRLVVLLRERILGECDALLVIETAGITFHHIRSILPLCDQIEVIIPEESDYSSDALRREISEVLSDLPSICQVIRISERTALGVQEQAPVRGGHS